MSGVSVRRANQSIQMNLTLLRLVVVVLLSIGAVPALLAEDWSVPLAGNTFRSQPGPGGRLFDPNGALRCSGSDQVFSVYFRVDRPGKVNLAIRARSLDGDAQVQASVVDQEFVVDLKGEAVVDYPLGEVSVSQPGYVRVDLQEGDRPESGVAMISDLLVSASVPGMKVDFVRDNDGNMFYWGRRGPSVHLRYQLPPGKQLTYAYNEITVPVGQDPIGSYFMSNGFSEGYFGFQVNSDRERRVLFSVWSPFKTDNPAEIPDADRIETVAKGADVSAQDFGNEGSGGQSFLRYPWKAGEAYRFLTEVKPDGKGNTFYTSWFGDKKKDEWRLIATFRRPKTDKHLTGFHSFLENFSPAYGHVGRSAHYGNQWVRDTEGEWHESSKAYFTADNTARRGHRLDYAGGSKDDHFFLRNCGFFAQPVSFDQSFERQSTAAQKPDIDFDALPRK